MNQEYAELQENMRFYGNMRFKQLTLFFAITGVLLAVQFGNLVRVEDISPVGIIPVIGIIIVYVFYIMEIRAADNYWGFRKLAKKYENDPSNGLVIKQFINLKKEKVCNATHAVHFLFLAFWIMWFYILSNNLVYIVSGAIILVIAVCIERYIVYMEGKENEK